MSHDLNFQKAVYATFIAIYLFVLLATIAYNIPDYYKALTGKGKYFAWRDSHDILYFVTMIYLCFGIVMFLFNIIYSLL